MPEPGNSPSHLWRVEHVRPLWLLLGAFGNFQAMEPEVYAVEASSNGLTIREERATRQAQAFLAWSEIESIGPEAEGVAAIRTRRGQVVVLGRGHLRHRGDVGEAERKIREIEMRLQSWRAAQ